MSFRKPLKSPNPALCSIGKMLNYFLPALPNLQFGGEEYKHLQCEK